jgi:hypothetical protein
MVVVVGPIEQATRELGGKERAQVRIELIRLRVPAVFLAGVEVCQCGISDGLLFGSPYPTWRTSTTARPLAMAV